MRLVLLLAGIGLSVAVFFSLYVRFVPSDPAQWHVDPRVVPVAPRAGVYLRREGAADGPPVAVAGTPGAALRAFSRTALSDPGVSVLAGTPEAGHMTFIARSVLFGFPDYVSVVAYPGDGGAMLAIYARLRFGASDFGVNRARVDRWLSAMARGEARAGDPAAERT